MKNNDKKSNQRMKSIVLLLLVSVILIGLLSSTAVKLASATYLMQKTQKPIITIPKIIEEIIGSVAPTSAPTTKAPTKAPAPTTQAPTTKAPTTQAPTTQAPTTQAPTTQAPTTQAPTTQPVTVDPDAGIKQDQANFNSYKMVVERAKLNPVAYTKTTNRTLDMSFFQSLAVSGAEDVLVNNAKYFNNEVTVKGVANADKDFIINNKKACLINASDLQATSAAISSSSKEVLKDGSVKIVINFNDEANPQPLNYNATATEGFISALMPVVTAEQVRYHADDQLGTDIESLNLLYTGCYVELVYNPVTGDIISLKQVVRYEVDGKDGFKSVGGTITETNTYTFG